MKSYVLTIFKSLKHINWYPKVSQVLIILGFSSVMTFAHTETVTKEIIQYQEVRPLPGNLDKIPAFNSNSPEIVLTEGILLSTFPPEGKKFPKAHLNFLFDGYFDIFAHHIAKAPKPDQLRTLYLGILAFNPSEKPVTIDILQAASYLSQPDAPFVELASFLDNAQGSVYAGPGGRVMDDILRGKRQADFPAKLVISPGTSQLLMNHPIPVRDLDFPINGRSTLMRLRSNGKLYLASLALFAKDDENGNERPPTIKEWKEVLNNYNLVTPRDRAPSVPQKRKGKILYGRVAGVGLGSRWRTLLTDHPGSSDLIIPSPGEFFSYGISTLPFGVLGTSQIQSAPMLVRYPDTAYMAHGNYGIEYNLNFPLYNPTKEIKKVSLIMQTPVKMDKLISRGLTFLDPPPPQIFFRGTVRVRYKDDLNIAKTRYIHLVQKRGEMGEPLVTVELQPGERRPIQVDFLYPPDASPPQVLTVKTWAKDS